jgi:DNA modification methylase
MPELADRKIDCVVTSPPYWSMLSNPGSENQEVRRKKKLRLTYSASERDVGNIPDYDQFLESPIEIYEGLVPVLSPNASLTVVVKNIKREHVLYPRAWDLAYRLARPNGMYQYLSTTLWCQDDIATKPFAVGIYWVSNIVHNYCLHFRLSPCK